MCVCVRMHRVINITVVYNWIIGATREPDAKRTNKQTNKKVVSNFGLSHPVYTVALYFQCLSKKKIAKKPEGESIRRKQGSR